MYLATFSRAAAITLVTVSLALGALGQQSIRTPDIPGFKTFVPNPEQMSFVRFGPFSGTADVAVGYTFTDNANTTETDKLSLNETFENVDLDLEWTLSPFNRIDLQLGGQLQENFYSNGTAGLNLVVLPGSEIQFEAKAGDVLLRAFERFAITQDPITDPSVAGQTNLNRLTNTIGAGVEVPLYHVDIGLEFDYTYSDTLGGSTLGSNGIALSASSPTAEEGGVLLNSFHLGGTLGFGSAPTLTYGLQVDASYNTGGGSSDFDVLSIGPFLRGHLTPLLEVDCGVGPLFTGGPGGGTPQYYAFLSVRHELSRVLQVLVGASHDSEFSSGLGVTQNNNIHLTAEANLSRQWIVTAGPFLNFGTVITGTFPGAFTQYGLTIDSAVRLNKRLSADISYRFTRRDGDTSAGRYTQNLVTFTVRYGF